MDHFRKSTFTHFAAMNESKYSNTGIAPWKTVAEHEDAGLNTGNLTEGSAFSASWMTGYVQTQVCPRWLRPQQAPHSSASQRCCQGYLHASRCLLRACLTAAPLLRPVHMVAFVMAQPAHIMTGSSTIGNSEVASVVSCQSNLHPIGQGLQLSCILKHVKHLQRARQKHLKRHSELILELQVALPLGRDITVWLCCVLLAAVAYEAEGFQASERHPLVESNSSQADMLLTVLPDSGALADA